MGKRKGNKRKKEKSLEVERIVIVTSLVNLVIAILNLVLKFL